MTLHPDVPPHRLLHSLSHLKGLHGLTLSIKQAPRIFQHHFISALAHAIAELDTTSLEHFSMSMLGVNHDHVRSLCGPQGLGSTTHDSLSEVLATRFNEGKLERLENAEITIQLDRSEFNQRLEEPRRLVREATFLPSLPAEKVRVVLKPKVGDVMYDSRQPV